MLSQTRSVSRLKLLYTENKQSQGVKMIKTNYDSRNYIYVLSTIDDFENILEIADTMQEMADILGVDLSAISRFVSRHSKGESLIYRDRKVERVKIYDYVFVVYEKELSSPLLVSRDLNNISKMTNVSRTTLSNVLYNRPVCERKRKHSTPQIHKLQGKYFLKQVDLLDLDINLSMFLESCIDKGQITKSLEDYESMEEINV